jgi:hypothetical protein
MKEREINEMKKKRTVCTQLNCRPLGQKERGETKKRRMKREKEGENRSI